jgi:hypothetical protein
MRNIVETINEGKQSRYAKIAKEIVTKDLGEEWDDEMYFDSVDEQLEDWNVWTDDMIKDLWHIISAIADGDDIKKYRDLADKYWE